MPNIKFNGTCTCISLNAFDIDMTEKLLIGNLNQPTTYIYIFIAIALNESIFLDVLHFPMKNIKVT